MSQCLKSKGALAGEKDASAYVWEGLVVSADSPSYRSTCHAVSGGCSCIVSQGVQQEGGNKKAFVHTSLHLIQ